MAPILDLAGRVEAFCDDERLDSYLVGSFYRKRSGRFEMLESARVLAFLLKSSAPTRTVQMKMHHVHGIRLEQVQIT